MLIISLVSVKAALGEFVGTTLFIFTSLGVAASAPSSELVTPLAFGLSITSLAYAFGHTSGGQFNPAVSVALSMAGALGVTQMMVNILMQLLGSLLGTLLMFATVHGSWERKGLGANALAPGVSVANAFLGEVVMTFLLALVVLETVVNKKSKVKNLAPVAIGFAVYLGNQVLATVDGCSINPARSFGPAVLNNQWGDFWLFVFAPITGGLIAVPAHLLLRWEGGGHNDNGSNNNRNNNSNNNDNRLTEVRLGDPS